MAPPLGGGGGVEGVEGGGALYQSLGYNEELMREKKLIKRQDDRDTSDG